MTHSYYTAMNKNNVFLADVSYVMYAEFHKFKSLHKYSKSDADKPFNIMNYHSRYKKEIIQRLAGINTMRKKHGEDGKWVYDVCDITDPKSLTTCFHNVVLVRDCKRARNWRLLEFPESAYKARRDRQKDRFDDKAYDIMYLEIIPQLERLGVKVISLDGDPVGAAHYPNEAAPTPEMVGSAGAEADDIIGTVCLSINKTYPSKKVFIITNDADFVQLKNPQVEIVNLKGHDVFIRSQSSLMADIKKYASGACTSQPSPQTMLTNKILSGDRSDNIMSISRWGKHKATMMTVDADALRDLLAKNPQAAEQFETSRRMMDMTLINASIRQRILSAWNDLKFLRL